MGAEFSKPKESLLTDNLKELIHLLVKSSFVQKVALLASATVLSQLITILISPLLTRIYSPEDFGVLGMFMACAVPVSVVSCLRYEMAIMLPESESDQAENVLALSILIAFLIGLLCSAVIIVWGSHISRMIGVNGLGKFMMLIPLLVTLHGLYLSFRMWNLRSKFFKLISITTISQTSGQSLFQIIAGIAWKVGAGGLIWGQVIGRAVAVSIMVFRSIKEDLNILKRILSIRGIVNVAKRYKNFPLYESWGIVFNSLSREWVVLVIGIWFGSKIAGLYFLGYRVLSIPLMVLSGAISDVFFEQGARASRSNNAAVTFIRTAQFLGLIALPISIIFIFVAPWGFAKIFGREWKEAGVYLQLLTPLFAMRFVAAPLSRGFSIYEKQKANLIWQILFFITGLIAINIGGYFGSIYISLLMYSLIGATMYAIMLYLCLGYSGGSFKDVFQFPLLGKKTI